MNVIKSMWECRYESTQSKKHFFRLDERPLLTRENQPFLLTKKARPAENDPFIMTNNVNYF